MAISMKHIIMLLAVSALLMLVAALPAFARNSGTEGGACCFGRWGRLCTALQQRPHRRRRCHSFQ